jgi:hypothetical protein
VEEQAKAELRRKHGALAEFTVLKVFLAFKTPSREDWDSHKKKIRSDKHAKGAALRELCQQALVTPADAKGDGDVQAFAAVLAKKPAFAAVVAKKLDELAGGDFATVDNGDDTCSLTVDGRTWTFASPDFESWEDAQEQLATSKNEQECIWRELAIRCAVDKTGLEQLFDRYPAAHECLGNALAALAGGAIQGEVKKG